MKKELDEQEIPFLQYTEEELTSNIHFWEDVIMTSLLGVLIEPWFNHVITFYLFVILMAIGLWMLPDYLYMLGQHELLTDYDYLITSDPEHKYRMVVSSDYLDQAYQEFGHPSKDEKDLYKAKAQNMMYKKTLEGYKDSCPANRGAYFIVQDGNLYWDKDRDTTLAFTSRDQAEAYINDNLEDIDNIGTLFIGITLDGKEVAND